MSTTPEVIETLKKAGTAVISDVFDNLGLSPMPLCNDLWPTRDEGESFAGPAYTVDGVHKVSAKKGDLKKLQAMDEMTPGVVAVFAGNGMRGVCYFGDLLASAMKCRGIAGAVVDGGVRDLAFLRELELPMMVRYRTPSQAISRYVVTSWQEPVTVRGALTDWVTVRPGDAIVADADGVIVVPAPLAPQVAQAAATWEEKDQAAREDIMGGMKLLDALAKHGAL